MATGARLLLTLRGIAGRHVTSAAPVLSWFISTSFREVARTDQELLVVSTQPVRRGLRPATPVSLAASRSYDRPGYVKIAFNFTVTDGFLATETRVLAPILARAVASRCIGSSSDRAVD